MKTALALIVAVAAAYDHGFPDTSDTHAHCDLNATLTGVSCADAQAKADELILANVDTDS